MELAQAASANIMFLMLKISNYLLQLRIHFKDKAFKNF